MAKDPAIFSLFEEICQVLDLFFNNPTYKPNPLQSEGDLNPTRDIIKLKIERIEQAWEWRNRVRKALRCQKYDINNCSKYCWPEMHSFCHGIYRYEIPWQRRFLSPSQCFAFWAYYLTGRWMEETETAIRKVHRNMERKGIIE